MPERYVPKYYVIKRVSFKSNDSKLVRLDSMLIDMIDNKMLFADVATKYGCSVSTLRNMIQRQRERGLKVDLTEAWANWKGLDADLLRPSSGGAKYKDSIIDRIRELRLEGYSQREVAGLLKISQATVFKYCKGLIDYRGERADPTEPYGGPHA